MSKANVSEINNVLKFQYCYGCGVCAASCPKKIISMQLNEDGFYAPRIAEPDKCVNCGICLDVCAFNHDDLALEKRKIKSWASWSNDDKIRQISSSGGVSYEVGKSLIERGYHAVGCRYDYKEQRAEHFIASTVDDFKQSIGSKYIQSYTANAFSQIKKKNEKYLIVGSPCQIDSFRRMIQKFRCEENFVLMDFFCHCVPSMHAWKAYLKMHESKIGPVVSVSWRNKFTGWQDSWVTNLKGLRGEYKGWKSKGDLFYRMFLGDLALAPQCKKCKYKYDHSSADIRIGDLWGKNYADNQEGVSAVVAFTEKGREIIESQKNITLIEHPLSVVAEGQQRRPVKSRFFTPVALWLLKRDCAIDGLLFRSVLCIQRKISKGKSLFFRVLRKLRHK